MITTYRLNVNELSIELINSIKAAYKDKEVEITVNEVLDETEYLLYSKSNKEQLIKASEDLEEGRGVTLTLKELQEKYSS